MPLASDDNRSLNAEFQRSARRDKKAFLSKSCKEIEEKNRMGERRDLFKKIRDTKGIFHAKIDTIKDKNSKRLIRGNKNTQKNCTKNVSMTRIIDLIPY